MLCISNFLLRARPADMKVGEVPVFDERAQSYSGRESLKLRESLDRQDIGALKCLSLTVQLRLVNY